MAKPITPVRTQPPGDQRCISYAVAAAIEAAACWASGTSLGAPELSVDDVFEQGGSQVGAIDGIAKAAPKGFVTTACRPVGAASRCPDPAPYLWRQRIRIIKGSDRVAAMRQELAACPIVLLMEVFENFVTFTGAEAYVPMGQSLGFHAVCIIDFEADENASTGRWLAKNSMGPAWGDAGFFRLRWRDKILKPEKLVFAIEGLHQ